MSRTATHPRSARFAGHRTGGAVGNDTGGNGGINGADVVNVVNVVNGEFARTSIGSARQWWHQSLLAAQGTADLIEQLQRFNAQALHQWAESLALADRDVEVAGDVNALMAVPTQLVNRQLDLTMRHVNEAAKLVLEAEVRWAERMREQATAMGQSWMENLGRAGEQA